MSAGAASTPAFLDEMRALQRGKGQACTTGNFIPTLDDAKQAAIRDAQAEGIAHSAIGRWLQTLGFPGSSESAARHLAGRCQCPRT